MRFRLLVCVVGLACLVAACQSAPPTLVIVATTTPDADSTAESSPNALASTQESTDLPVTNTPAPTATPDPFPTPILTQWQVAEQPFEGGRMFWVQPRDQIWVLIVTSEGRGTWTPYADTFEEGEIEIDPDIEAPRDDVYQPRRGFGKLWRENDAVREALGWALTPDEFGYISRYEYHAGGTVSSNNVYTAAPGYHILFSLYEEAFRFNEGDFTWQLGRGD